MVTPNRQHVGPSVVAKLRRMFAAAYGHPWPHSNDYLCELWREAKSDLGLPQNVRGKAVAHVYDATMELMKPDA